MVGYPYLENLAIWAIPPFSLQGRSAKDRTLGVKTGYLYYRAIPTLSPHMQAVGKVIPPCWSFDMNMGEIIFLWSWGCEFEPVVGCSHVHLDCWEMTFFRLCLLDSIIKMSMLCTVMQPPFAAFGKSNQFSAVNVHLCLVRVLFWEKNLK